MQIGYARVSTKDQDLRLQLNALNDVGCEKIYDDRASGSSSSRHGLKQALTDLRKGELLISRNVRIGESH